MPANPRKTVDLEKLKKLKEKLEETGKIRTADEEALKQQLARKVEKLYERNEYFQKAPDDIRVWLMQQPLDVQLKILDRMEWATQVAPLYTREVLKDPVEAQIEFWDFLGKQGSEELGKVEKALRLSEQEKLERLKEKIRKLKKE